MTKLSDVLAEKAKADIQVGGSTFKIVWYVLWRQRFSDDEWDQVLSLKGREYLKLMLPRVMVSWDLVDDDGHAIPVTAEAIDEHQIPDRLLYACEQRALGSDLLGKALPPPTSSNSPGT